jgi:integrase
MGPVMGRIKNKLTARTAATLMKAGKSGKWSDGDGLYLRIDAAARCRWFFKFTGPSDRKPREMGLGGFPDVPLSEARKARDEAKRLAQAGKDPIIERDAAKRAREGKVTFGAVAEEVIQRKGAASRNATHRHQWRMTLERYAARLWPLPVDEIDTAAILAVLTPLWQLAPETASRLRGRIETVLDAARAQGHILRNEANPARWKGHLDQLLPKRSRLSRGHHSAMPYAEVPDFMRALRQHEGMAALALAFSILTATRRGEVLGARWDEIDLDVAVWTIPAERMKAGREHRVPLSDRALAILQDLGKAQLGPFVFAGQPAERPLSDTAMNMLLRRMGVTVTPHGFRSSFRDWCGDETQFPREVAEAALAHSVGNEVERSYRRGDALEQRRKLMQAWAEFCSGETANVVPLRREG